MTVITDPRHVKRYFQCAEQPVSSWNISEYTAPATQNDSPTFQRNFSKTAETSFPMRGRSENDPSMIRATSEQETVRRNPPRNRGDFSRSPRAFSIEKYNISRSGYHSKFHRILRLPRKVTVQHHQILRLPRKVTVMTDPRHIWHVTYNARNNQCHPPTSPNTAPATQNDCDDWSSYMKRYLQCAEQQVASSNITKYCACHAKWFSKISETFLQNRWNVNYNARPIRAGSEHDPSMIREWNRHSATRLATEVTFHAHHRHCIEKCNMSRSGYHSKFHQILRLPQKVTLQLHQILRLPRKVTLERHQIMHLPRKVTLERHQIVHLPRKVTLERHKIVIRI